jgi:hypothetical protein
MKPLYASSFRKRMAHEHFEKRGCVFLFVKNNE